jgi:3'-phosphoadenosine 5'-phosphosulfate sulfotransferase (PAPS reductase)/FAD synthetase
MIVVNVSGGKDSAAVLALALERGVEFVAAWADTGHEHPQTVEYIDTLQEWAGVPIQRIRADFTAQIERKRATVEKWPEPMRSDALAVLHPTGNPFLDMCIWAGRFPGSFARFCTKELKIIPIRAQLIDPLLDEHGSVMHWLGVRADESKARANLTEIEAEFFDPATGDGYWFCRPILHWTADDVFAYLAKRGAPVNPLYRQGMSRVGCMPCIHARKSELSEIFKRWPEEVRRVAEWERIVSAASKVGCATFFTVSADPLWTQQSTVNQSDWNIMRRVEWASTARGGLQTTMDFDDAPTCSSVYGLCE